MVSPSVRRAIARDDLLMMARDAQIAVGIVKSHDQKFEPGAQAEPLTEVGLFEKALELQMLGAQAPLWASRAQHLHWAAIIIRFAKMVDVDISTDLDDRELFRQAMAEHAVAGDPESSLYRDPAAGITIHHRAARNLRLDNDTDAAAELADRSEEFFHGAGAIPLFAEFQYELGACLIHDGQVEQVAGALEESEVFWAKPENAAKPTSHRFHFIRALEAWELGRHDEVGPRIDTAMSRLAAAESLPSMAIRAAADHRAIQRLSLVLSRAEQRALMDSVGGSQVADDARGALKITEEIRSRWAVISRSRSPLAIAFRRIYGDIALLAAELAQRGDASEEAAHLGFSVALAAKRTGLAAMMRAGRSLMTPRVRATVTAIMRWEEQLAGAGLTDQARAEAVKDLGSLGLELQTEISAILADTVQPKPAVVDDVIGQIGSRIALDYTALPTSLSRPRTTEWFRTVVDAGTVSFDRMVPGAHYETYFQGRDGEGPWVGQLEQTLGVRGPDWRGLGDEILPTRVRETLRHADPESPAELVISPHQLLAHLPWSALRLDDGAALVERAVISQTPVLTLLDGQSPGPAVGPALLWLVHKDPVRGDLAIEDELTVWGLPKDDIVRASVDAALTRSDLATDRLADALSANPTPWRFLHLAAHGDGEGLGQRLHLPAPLTAGEALGLAWPESVLLASCELGRVMNVEDAELFGFVVAVFAGGARSVVAALGVVPDRATSELAAEVVRKVHKGQSLPRALREAQLAAVREEQPVFGWAQLSAFIR